MTRYLKISATALALVVLALAAGCEKRPTGLDPNPNSPEGVPSPDARLVTFRNEALPILVRDYASTNIDSVLSSLRALSSSPTTPLLTLFDGTPANSFEFFRRDGAGKFTRTTDFPQQSTYRFVNVGYEMYFSPDPAPGSFAPPSYMARGLVDGVATHQSPLTNESRLAAPNVQPITYDGDRQPLDSLFVVSWVGVLDAAGYWVHIYEKPIAGFERAISSLPAPIAYVTAGDLFIGYVPGNHSSGSVRFRLGDRSLLTLKYGPPLLGHDYLVRVTAVDASGQVIARTPGDLDSLAMSADLAFLAPPGYSADKTKLFFSLGGVRVARRTLTPRITEGDAAEGVPLGAAQTLVRHVPQLGFPSVGPLQQLTAPHRTGRR